MLDVRWNPSGRELRQFGWLCLLFAALGGAIVAYRSSAWNTAVAIWAVGSGVALLGAAKPVFLKPFFVGWMAAAYPIGWIVSNAVLAATFYLVLTPIGLVMRLFGRDPLGRRRHRSPGSYWVAHEPSREPGSYFRQF
jgi:hypothetical protein